MRALDRVFLRHQHGRIVAEVEIGGNNVVVGERVLDHIDARGAQHREEARRVADAGDGVNALPGEISARLLSRPIDAAAALSPTSASGTHLRGRLPPLQTRNSTVARRASGSRSGPAGSSRPLPKRRSPSITQISTLRESA